MPAITLYRDDNCRIEYYPKTASTAFAFGELVMAGTSGQLEVMTDGANVVQLGRVMKTVAATDSDYADTTRLPVEVCGPNAEYLCDIGNGTGATGDVGEFIDLDGNGTPSQNVDVSNSTFDVLEVTQFISTTQVICKFNSITGVLHTGPAS